MSPDTRSIDKTREYEAAEVVVDDGITLLFRRAEIILFK
jgi:hypothetical protein